MEQNHKLLGCIMHTSSVLLNLKPIQSSESTLFSPQDDSDQIFQTFNSIFYSDVSASGGSAGAGYDVMQEVFFSVNEHSFLNF